MSDKLIVRLWKSRVKHLQGQHNQKKHGYRGAKISNESQNTDSGSEQFSSQISLSKTDKSYQKEPFASKEVANSMQKSLDKYSKYFGFTPQITLSRGSKDFALRKALNSRSGNEINWITEVKKNKGDDNSFNITIDHDVLESYLNTAEKMNFPKYVMDENGISLQSGMKMTREKLRDHIVGAAVAQAYYKSMADVTPGVTQTFRGSVGSQPRTYTSASFENNPKIVEWIKMYSYKKGVDSHMPVFSSLNNVAGITSTQRRSIALTGLYNAMSSFTNGEYLPTNIRQFILDNFYQKTTKEVRYKHLQGLHNQKKHGQRGGTKINLEAISGLDAKTQTFYAGLSTKDQVKFRLAWYREKAKNPNADPAAFAKAFQPGAAAPKAAPKPKAPKAAPKPKAPKAAPAAAPAPVAAPPAKASGLVEPADMLWINKNLRKDIRPEVDSALAAIASVHKIPDKASKIWVRQNDSMSNNGSFESTLQKDGTLDPDGIFLSKFSSPSQRQGVFCHEYGHYLKDEINRNFSTPAVQKALADVETAIGKTKAYQRLNTNLKAGGDPMIKGVDGNQYRLSHQTLDYMIAKHETFARAYAQYIAYKTGNKTLIDSVFGSWDNGHVMVAQWSQNDFADVTKAFDNLFSELGW